MWGIHGRKRSARLTAMSASRCVLSSPRSTEGTASGSTMKRVNASACALTSTRSAKQIVNGSAGRASAVSSKVCGATAALNSEEAVAASPKRKTVCERSQTASGGKSWDVRAAVRTGRKITSPKRSRRPSVAQNHRWWSTVAQRGWRLARDPSQTSEQLDGRVSQNRIAAPCIGPWSGAVATGRAIGEEGEEEGTRRVRETRQEHFVIYCGVHWTLGH